MGETTENNNKDTFEKINSRLLEPVQVRNITAGNVTLVLEKNNGQESTKRFKAHQIVTIKVQDLIAIAPNTKLFTGEDGKGTNAMLYIEDNDLRKYLGFDNYDAEGKTIKQSVLDEKTVLKIIKEKDEEIFKESIVNVFNNIIKKRILEDVIKNTAFNDAKKIKYIENTLRININL